MLESYKQKGGLSEKPPLVLSNSMTMSSRDPQTSNKSAMYGYEIPPSINFCLCLTTCTNSLSSSKFVGREIELFTLTFRVLS